MNKWASQNNSSTNIIGSITDMDSQQDPFGSHMFKRGDIVRIKGTSGHALRVIHQVLCDHEIEPCGYTLRRDDGITVGVVFQSELEFAK